MELDLIHDIQSTYRKVLNSMARPGIIENIKDEADKVNVDIDCYKSTFLIMLMLLDDRRFSKSDNLCKSKANRRS